MGLEVGRLWQMNFFGWSSEIHRAGIGDVEQQVGFEEKKEEPFLLPPLLFPSLIIVCYSHNIVLAEPFKLLGPPSTSGYSTEDPAPRLNYSTSYTSNCTSASRELHGYYPEKKSQPQRAYTLYPLTDTYFVNLLLSVVFYCCPRSLCTVYLFMSGSPHSSLATPTPTSLVVPSRNMHSLPTTSPVVFNTHISSDGQHSDPGKSSTSPSFASVVSSSAGSSSAIPVTPSSFQLQSVHLDSTTTISSSTLAQQQHQQQNLYHQQQQKHEHGQTSPPSAVLLSNYNNKRNSAPLRAPSSVSSSSRSNRSPSSSTYDSTLASPGSHGFSANQSSNGSTCPDQSGSDSSDVEIYLNSLVLHESVSRMQSMCLLSFIFAFL